MGDLPGSGLRADPNGADCQLTVADDGCGKRRLALAARDRQALARNGLLIDQRAPVDDLAVDRDHLAWVDDDLVADREFRCRDRDHGAVADNPRGFGLKFEEFAHGTPRPSRGQIANPVAKLDEPRNNRTCQRIALGERREDRQRIEEIHVEPPFPTPDPPGPQCNRISVPQHQRQVDGADDRIGAECEQQRHGRQRERRAQRLRWRYSGTVCGTRDNRRFAILIACGHHEPAQVVEIHQRQAADNRAQQRLVGDVVLDHETRAVIVDARALDPCLGAQPRERRVGQWPSPAERGHIKAHAPRDEVANRKFHRAS